jgi:nucleolar protein 53
LYKIIFLILKKPKNPLYKKSALPSIELPHPGTSYNPDYDDHQELLLQAHVIELKKLQDEQRLMRKLALHAKKMSWAEMEVNIKFLKISKYYNKY